MVLDAGHEARAAAATSTLLVGTALTGRLKQLANELTHQYPRHLRAARTA